MKTEFDVVVRGGSVADGLGSPLFRADVGWRDGIIEAVGDIQGRGKSELDAAGCVVTPGFVDIHTHYDGQAVWDNSLASSSWHGVTTAVMGNCGVGFAPVRPHDRSRLIELMEGVEDIPGVALHEGLDWSWESFGEYMNALERRAHDIDLCAQLPHAALRVYVMGQRAAELEPATDDDLARMRELAREAVRAGALGFSTSRSIHHRSASGDPTPSLRATEKELLEIALGLAEAGRGVLQVMSDFDTPSMDEEFAMLRRIVEKSGRPLSFTVIQRHDRPEAWKQLLAHLEDAVKAGLPMRGQVAPRPVGMLMGLQATLNPFSGTSTYAEIADLPLDERVRLMRREDFKRRLLSEVRGFQRKRLDVQLLFPLSDPPNYEPAASTALGERAKMLGRNPEELAYEALLEQDGRAFLYAPFANYHEKNLGACREMIAHPHTVIGLSDGGAHVGIVCDASFPTFLLTHWSKECGRQDGFDLTWLVKRQTSDTARAVGLLDRGVVSAGMKADLNVIDPSKLELASPYMKFDLPAGGKRLLQSVNGIRATFVSGVATYLDGTATGHLPGRVVRGSRLGALATQEA